METRLQSNEIRIPKPEFHLKNGPDSLNNNSSSSYFKSSFARSLSSFGGGSGSGSRSLDFVNTSCCYSDCDDTPEQGTLLHHEDSDSPLSLPHFATSGYAVESDSEDLRRIPEQSSESLVSCSSVATTVKQVGVSSHLAVLRDSSISISIPGQANSRGYGNRNAGTLFRKSNKNVAECESAEIEVLRLRKVSLLRLEEVKHLRLYRKSFELMGGTSASLCSSDKGRMSWVGCSSSTLSRPSIEGLVWSGLAWPREHNQIIDSSVLCFCDN